MKRVYLIRHARPDFPGGKKMCLGSTDIPLGPEGLEQARNLAASLPPVSAVFSSPLSRAIQTARALGLPVTELEGLKELDCGQWDGLTFDEIRSRFPELYEARGADLSIPIPGSEDPKQGLVRFQQAMEQAARLSAGDFAVIAHGGIIAKFMEALTGTETKPDYAQCICLVFRNEEFLPQQSHN